MKNYLAKIAYAASFGFVLEKVGELNEGAKGEQGETGAVGASK